MVAYNIFVNATFFMNQSILSFDHHNTVKSDKPSIVHKRHTEDFFFFKLRYCNISTMGNENHTLLSFIR